MSAAEPDLRSNEAAKFLIEFVARLQPLQTEVNLAWWIASTKGDDDSFQKKQEAENRIVALLADPVRFQRLSTLRECGGISDRVVARQIDVLYLRCLEKQVPFLLLQEISTVGNRVRNKFPIPARSASE